MSRGGYNIDYDTGFKIENDLFSKYYDMLKNIIMATQLEQTARGLMDKCTGTDAVALINGIVYGVSLRFRNGDYHSFTLNRHINDEYSEVNKWIRNRNESIKPAVFIQVAETFTYYRLIRVNIDAFSYYLEKLIKSGELDTFYNNGLFAYEFKLDALKNVAGIFTTVIKK